MKQKLKNGLLTCVLGLVFIFSACTVQVEKGIKTVGVNVLIGDNLVEYSIRENVGTAEDVLNALKEKDQTFSYGATQSEYGLMLDSVLGKTADASKGEYWVVYTSDFRTDDKGVPNAYIEYTYEHEGITYYSCALGLSSYEVKEGETLLFMIITY